jgi:hypothetical protein
MVYSKCYLLFPHEVKQTSKKTLAEGSPDLEEGQGTSRDNCDRENRGSFRLKGILGGFDTHRLPVIELALVGNFLQTAHRDIQMESTSPSDSGEVDNGPHCQNPEVSL